VPSAAPLAGVGELGKVVKQAAALVGCQRDGRVQLLRGGGNAR
jgi:PHP family Zn ribbon phosphoesterase